MLENNIKNLIKILEESKIDELEVTTFWGKQKIKISRNTSPSVEENIKLFSDTAEPLSEKSTEPIELHQSDEELVQPSIKTDEIIPKDSDVTSTIKAPLVGTYYAAPKPGESPFLSEGDSITKGQIICIIEAMKIFNEIESEISGKVIKLLIKDGTPVEYDQDLIVVAPE